jgi:hypothetical protein
MRGAAILALVFLAILGMPAGCQSIAGIKDHTFPAQCEPYCTDVQKCLSTAGYYSSLYQTKATCLGICTEIQPGTGLEGQSNDTVACRDGQLRLGEPNCAAAGPGGGGTAVVGTCGTDCEAYCSLLHRICPDAFSVDFPPSADDPEALCRGACEKGLATVPYSVDDRTISTADTLQCRLWHLSTATVEGVSHCPHAQLHPNAQCADDPNGANYCAHVCKVNQAACGTTAYASIDECMAVCAALPLGAPDDQSQNTRACRLWHSFSALTFPIPHCFHTTSGGDGHCGTDNCESYCLLVNSDKFKQVCPAESARIPADCKTSCATLAGAGVDQWSTVDGGAGTVQCLFRHLNRALAGIPSADGGPTECQMAARLADCQ